MHAVSGPISGVHNVAVGSLSGKLNKLTPFMNLRPQAIGSHFCCFLTVALLDVSLPAEEDARGYAENRIRYSNMCMCSPTSSCIFRGQPSPPLFVFFSWLVNQIGLARFSDIPGTNVRMCARTRVCTSLLVSLPMRD